jgi:glutamyl-tRNA synthetase
MTTQKRVRVRFAPSPTGYLHVGGARSALFNFLFARRTGGDFLLRIEDTDRTRFVEDALTEIYDSLKWLGLEWDEGPGVGGEHGPYVQSERLDIYGRMADKLIGSGHAYRCFCTPEHLAEVRAAQEKSGGATGYDKRCRNLPSEEVAKNLESGVPYVVRLKIPEGRVIAFDDLIRGRIEYKSETLDDLVLIKADKFPTYHLANVVDDHEMAITHVLRGDEWIASTPRHVLLYEAFGWEPPAFAHLPVILSPDGGKLSKRKGAASVLDYKRGGILPEALFNFLALLGWAPGGDVEKMSAEEMIAAFSLERVSPKAAVLDEKKLEWMNGQYLAERKAETLVDDVVSMWADKGWINNAVGINRNGINKEYARKVIDLLKVRSRRVTELADSASYFFIDPTGYDEKAAKKHFTPGTAERLRLIHNIIDNIDDFTKENIDTAYHAAAESGNMQLSALIHPTRLAISGVSAGPGLFEMMELLGKDTVLRRIDKAVNVLD